MRQLIPMTTITATEALAAARSAEQQAGDLTDRLAFLETSSDANSGLPLASSSVSLLESSAHQGPVVIVNLPAGTSVQLVVEVLSAFSSASVVELAAAGTALPLSVWHGPPLDPTTPGTYVTAPVGSEEALLLTRRGVLTASVVTSTATHGEARVTVHHPPARRGADGILNVQEWGVLPENDSATNTANLYALRDWCRARPDTMHHIVFPPSEDVYWVNRSDWLRGIRKFRLSGYGAKIGSDYGGLFKQGWHGYTCVVNAGMFYDYDGLIGDPNTSSHQSPYVIMGNLINTAISGQRDVTLSAAGSFAPGDNVLIYGLQQQDNSAPPNPRYFEFNKIKGVNGNTLKMKRPLRHTYREDWPEQLDLGYVFNHGRARVLNLNRPDFNICEHAVIEGITFFPRLANHHMTFNNGYLRVCGCLDVVVRDCRMEAFIINEVHNVAAENCIVTHYSEQDKITSKQSYQNCRLPYLSQGYGVEQLSLDQCEITNFREGTDQPTYSYSYARRLRITNSTFLNGATYVDRFAALELGPSVGKETAVIEGNVFHVPQDVANAGSTPIYWAGQRNFREIPLASEVNDGSKTTTVEFSDPSLYYIRQVREGDVFIYAENPGPSTIGYIKKIYEGSQYDSGGKRVALNVETDRIFMEGSLPRIIVPGIRSLRIQGNRTVVSGETKMNAATDEYFSVNAISNDTEFSLDGTSRTVGVFGIVVEIVFDVIRPYTGAGATPRYIFRLRHEKQVTGPSLSTGTRQTLTKTLADLSDQPIKQIQMDARDMPDLSPSTFERPLIKVRVKTVLPRV